tara:strand:- start:98 stop:415 length:318 start_codon:yes stop_codon:yes gene_type:complete
MSTVDQSQSLPNTKLHLLWRTIKQSRIAIVTIFAAGIILFAAFACTTIQTRDSIFAPFTLQLLVALLSSVAASLLLIAFGKHQERLHLRTWAIVAAGWFCIIALT